MTATTMTDSVPTPAAKTLLLDMDGVLAEVSKSYRTSIISTCQFYNADSITHETISEWKVRGGCNNDWVLSLDLINTDPNGTKNLTLEQVTETFERFYQGQDGTPGMCDTETLIPEKSVLEELRRRCGTNGMAIVTGRPRKDCDHFLKLHGLDHLFDACVCMEDGPAKPDPFPVRRACELLGVTPSKDVIMVGDTPDDIRAAVAAGCVGVGVSTPEGADLEECKLCSSMRESGAVVIMRPGFKDLLDMFPEV